MITYKRAVTVLIPRGADDYEEHVATAVLQLVSWEPEVSLFTDDDQRDVLDLPKQHTRSCILEMSVPTEFVAQSLDAQLRAALGLAGWKVM